MDKRTGCEAARKIQGLVSSYQGFPGGSVVKNPATNAGDTDLMPGLGRSSGEGNGYPLQYSCLERSMDRGAWWVIVHGVAKESDTTQQLNNNKVVIRYVDLVLNLDWSSLVIFFS